MTFEEILICDIDNFVRSRKFPQTKPVIPQRAHNIFASWPKPWSHWSLLPRARLGAWGIYTNNFVNEKERPRDHHVVRAPLASRTEETLATGASDHCWDLRTNIKARWVSTQNNKRGGAELGNKTGKRQHLYGASDIQIRAENMQIILLILYPCLKEKNRGQQQPCKRIIGNTKNTTQVTIAMTK